MIDTSILIECLRGRPDAVAFIAGYPGGPVTHVAAVVEVLAGACDKPEQTAIDRFCRRFEVIAPTDTDTVDALNLFRAYRLSHGVDWPDCLIAATALRRDLEVFTRNAKHFRAFPGLRFSGGY